MPTPKPAAEPGPTDFLTTQEVAQLLRIDVQTVRRWIRDKQLPAVAFGTRAAGAGYRIRRGELERFIGARVTVQQPARERP